MPTFQKQPEDAMLLAIYLNDHLAGATAGRELARRTAASNRSSPYGRSLDGLAEEIDADRQSLLEIMSRLNVRVDPLKIYAAWGAEKVARLKPNGRLRGYSPLSRVIELEGLALGVRGKLALWKSLERLQPQPVALDPAKLTVLRERAEAQLTRLEELRLDAVAQAFSDG
jgi:hypothetical protein